MSSRTKLIAGLAAAVVIGVAVAVGGYFAFGRGGGDKPARPADGKFSNAKLRYAFEYPSDWTDTTDLAPYKAPAGSELLEEVSVGNVDKDTGVFRGAYITVFRISHTVKTTDDLNSELTGLDDTFKRQAAAVSGKLDEPQTAQLGGLTARQYLVQFAYTSTQIVFDVASSQVVTFFGDRQYVVNCQGPSNDFNKTVTPGCEHLLQSFRFR